MGDKSIRMTDDGDQVTTTPAVPPQVLARWAALAAQRASLASLPHQIRVAS